MNTIAKVAEFHVAFGAPIAGSPSLPPTRQHESIDLGVEALRAAFDTFKYGAELGCRRCTRLLLITEELRELAEALRDDDLEGALDALVDLRYVNDGTVVEFGLNAPNKTCHGDGSRFNLAFARVHAANMAKLGPDGKPIVDAKGKVRKPAGWTAPDLSDLVL